MDTKYLQVLRDSKSLEDQGMFFEQQFQDEKEILMQETSDLAAKRQVCLPLHQQQRPLQLCFSMTHAITGGDYGIIPRI